MTASPALLRVKSLAAAKATVKRPKSPVAKPRAHKHPPAGELEHLDKVSPEVPSELSDDAEGCPPNLLKLNLRLADNLSDWSGYVRDLFKVRAPRYLHRFGKAPAGAVVNHAYPIGQFRPFILFDRATLHRGGRLKGRWAW